MKLVFIIAALIVCSLRIQAQQTGGTVSGVVTDSVSGKPLPGVSVFLNNTAHGTATRSNGTFDLPGVPQGSWQLVFSAVGFRTKVIDISSSRLPVSLTIPLQQQATELQAVTVEPYDEHGWAKWGKFFLQNFIGAGINSIQCTLKNPTALHFHYSKRSNWLSVTATEPLHIENNALGYDLSFELEAFTADLNSKSVRYFGYPFFQERTTTKPDRKRDWEMRRREAYNGSLMHFFRSLYAGHSIRDGFLAERQLLVPNEEKHRIKEIYRPDFQKPGAFPMDTLHYFWEVLRQPETILKTFVIPPDSILTVGSDGVRELYFNGRLAILYGVNARETNDYRVAGLEVLGANAVVIERNGYYHPALDLLTTGAWAQSEKIANLLPFDYEPH